MLATTRANDHDFSTTTHDGASVARVDLDPKHRKHGATQCPSQGSSNLATRLRPGSESGPTKTGPHACAHLHSRERHVSRLWEQLGFDVVYIPPQQSTPPAGSDAQETDLP